MISKNTISFKSGVRYKQNSNSKEADGSVYSIPNVIETLL